MVEHHPHAGTGGELASPAGDVARAVVERVVGAERQRPLDLDVGAGGGEHGGAGVLGELDRRHGDAGTGGVDQHRLAG